MAGNFISIPMLQNKKQNHNDCQSLREWHCQPDSRHTQELRQQNKTRNKENKATQQSKNRSWLYSFNTLKITYHSNIHNEKDKAACKIGETVYRYLRRFTVKTDEKTDQQIRINSECHRCNHTADHSRQQRNTFRRHHSFLVAQSEIIADNRLGRLCNSITYHENKRNIIARYTECPYAIVPQIGHKYLIPDEHKNSKRCLSQ